MNIVNPPRSISSPAIAVAAASSSSVTLAFQSAKLTGSSAEAPMFRNTPRQLVCTMWLCASMKPGWAMPPAASMVSVAR